MARRKRNGDDEPSIGHNSGLSAPDKKALGGYVKEIEYLNEQMTTLRSDLSNLYKDAKEHGFDTRAIRHVVKMRRMEADAREAFESAMRSRARNPNSRPEHAPQAAAAAGVPLGCSRT